MSLRLSGLNPLSYQGVEPSSPPQLLLNTRQPTTTDVQNFNIGTLWVIPTRVNQPQEEIWMLMGVAQNVGTWVQIYPGNGGGGGASTFITDSGNANAVNGDINIYGGSNIDTTGAGMTVTVNLHDSVSITGTFDAVGNITSSGGNITADVGDIIATAGSVIAGLDVTAGGDVGAGDSITAANDITATNGNIVASVGNIDATLGDITAGGNVTGDNLIANDEITAVNNITTSSGDVIATIGNIQAVAGDVTAGNDLSVGNNATITNDLTITSLTAGVVQSDSGGMLSASNGTNGQVLIGGGTAPAWANITSTGGSVTITNGPNSINLEAAGGGGGGSPYVFSAYLLGNSPNFGTSTKYFGAETTLITTANVGGAFYAGNGAGLPAKFTVPMTGKYSFTFYIRANVPAAPVNSNIEAQIVVNLGPTGYVYISTGMYVINGVGSSTTCSTVIALNAGDIVQFGYATNNTGNLVGAVTGNPTFGTIIQSCVSGFKV